MMARLPLCLALLACFIAASRSQDNPLLNQDVLVTGQNVCTNCRWGGNGAVAHGRYRNGRVFVRSPKHEMRGVRRSRHAPTPQAAPRPHTHGP